MNKLAKKNSGRKRLVTVYRFRILNHHLNDQGIGFVLQDMAADWVLHCLEHVDFPYFIEDEGGDLVELIYAGVRWGAKE